jgi:sterol-4alpha-carboxylate 3-dehydrogenase (decarboxylating)
VDFLDSNRKNGLLTPLMVALRPAGIFGWVAQIFCPFWCWNPCSALVIAKNRSLPGLWMKADSLSNRRWHYIGNVAHIHGLTFSGVPLTNWMLLRRLLSLPPSAPTEKKLPPHWTKFHHYQRKKVSQYTLLSYRFNHRLPSYTDIWFTAARTIFMPQHNAERILSAFKDPKSGPSNRPVIRTRFDAFLSHSLVQSNCAIRLRVFYWFRVHCHSAKAAKTTPWSSFTSTQMKLIRNQYPKIRCRSFLVNIFDDPHSYRSFNKYCP